MLTQFFRAAKARDNTTLAMMSAVTLDPREQGTVEDFTITSVTPEARRPLDLKTLLEAERRAREAEAEFAKRKMEYQNANLPVLEQVVKLERDPAAKMTPAQQAVKTAWDKWRAESSTFTKAVSDARAAVVAATGPAAVVADPAGPAAVRPVGVPGRDRDQGRGARRRDAQSRRPDAQQAPHPDDDARRRDARRREPRRTMDYHEDCRRLTPGQSSWERLGASG